MKRLLTALVCTLGLGFWVHGDAQTNKGDGKVKIDVMLMGPQDDPVVCRLVEQVEQQIRSSTDMELSDDSAVLEVEMVSMSVDSTARENHRSAVAVAYVLSPESERKFGGVNIYVVAPSRVNEVAQRIAETCWILVAD